MRELWFSTRFWWCGALSLLLGEAPVAAADFLCAGLATSAVPNEQRAAKVAIPKRPISPQAGAHLLVIFAQFSDENPGDENVPEYAADLFDPDLPGSFAHFYHTMSFARFPVTGTVLPRRYRSARPAVAYLADIPGEQGRFDEFVREILEQVDEEVDLRLFDNDGPDGLPDSGDDDGWVDYIYLHVRSTPWGFLRDGATGISYLGFGNSYSSEDIGYGGSPVQISGGAGAVSREGDFAVTVGTMAHEFGHTLGLPDLYDLEYDTPAEDSAGIGRWGLMGWGALGWSGNDGPNPFSAWSLEQLGWIGVADGRLVEVVGDVEGVEVADLQAGGAVLKIPLRAGRVNETSYLQEYLLLEQRVRSGSFYNRNLPGEGLLVWHVRPQMTGNNDEVSKWVDLVCADGLYGDAGYPSGQVADGWHGGDNLDFWSHEAAYRQTHGGNWGDGTDPFEGVRFTRFGLGTNPSTDPQGLLPPASTGLSVALRRQGAAMVVDAVFPRWSGIIDGEVHWTGWVRVDGDLRVAPQGRLVVHTPARVFFAGTDRLRQGLDPNQIELHLQGDFIIFHASNSFSGLGDAIDQQVLFAAQDLEESWYGIVFDLAVRSQFMVPDNSYELHHSERGFVFPDGTSIGQSLGLVVRHRIDDRPGLVTAGNGDGLIAPGETFQPVFELMNGSLEAYPALKSRLRWTTPWLYPAWDASGPQYVDSPASFALNIGGKGAVVPTFLTLSPQAPQGERIEFIAEFSKRATYSGGKRVSIARDTLTLQVAGHYPAHQIRFEVPGHTVRDQVATIDIDRPSTIRALVRGEVDAMSLVVRSQANSVPQSEIPMQLEEVGEVRVFVGHFQPPEAGSYQLVPRVRSAGGEEVFSPNLLMVSAILGGQPVLVIKLRPNYPNPFNAQTVIGYELPQAAPVQLTIYNLAGQPVRQLVRRVQHAGAYRVVWDSRDQRGRPVSSGVYLYRLKVGTFQQTRRLVVLK